MSRSLCLVAACLAGTAFAQITATVGPSPAALGGNLGLGIANDTGMGFFLPTPCPWQIRDSNNVVVYAPNCPPTMPYVAPGLVFQSLISMAGFAAGTYYVDVFLPGGVTSTHAAIIDPQVQAGLTTLGPIRIGTSRYVLMDSVLDGGYQYLMAASDAPVSGGMPTCAGLVPLEDDAVLALSLGPNPYFFGFYGTVNPTGQVWTAYVTTPNDPNLIGVQVHLGAVVLDSSMPCPIRRVTAPFSFTIQ